MEWLVEEVLKFHCFLPTVYNFLWFYLKAAGANSDLENRAKNFAVLVLADKVQFCYFPSTIAAAVVILASLGEKQDAPSQRVIEVQKYKYLSEGKLLLSICIYLTNRT
ncbi:hypothetical protein IC575_030857 [Cucumis melo]